MAINESILLNYAIIWDMSTNEFWDLFQWSNYGWDDVLNEIWVIELWSLITNEVLWDFTFMATSCQFEKLSWILRCDVYYSHNWVKSDKSLLLYWGLYESKVTSHPYY